jgi:hypothetical protein
MDPKPEDLAEFFRTRKIGFGRCLEPTMQCGEPAIRAHSIQNRQTIALPDPPPKSVTSFALNMQRAGRSA